MERGEEKRYIESRKHKYIDLGRPRKKIVLISFSCLLVLSFAMFFLNFNINLGSLPVTGHSILMQADSVAQVNVDFSKEIGIIRGDFYGANTHGFLGRDQRIDANVDGTLDSYSYTEWHREKWLESGMGYIRDDMGLGWNYFYDSWDNLDFENWTNESVGFFNSSKETGAVGWKVSPYGGAFGFASRSEDSRSGSYSLNVSCNKESHVYVYRNVGFKIGNNYNFSIWVKSNGTISLIIQRLDNYQSCGSTSVSGDGTEWKHVSVSCNNAPYSGYRAVIDAINKDESVLLDDASLTENSLPYIPIYYFAGNLSAKTDRLKWAEENNIRILTIADYMPTWLADTSMEGCNKSKRTDCMPYDIELWKDLVIDYIDRVTENGKYDNMDIEVWNEPYLGSLLSELPYDSPTKSFYYNQLYDATYHAIKAKYPNIAVGGPSGYHGAPNMLKGFLSNFSKQMDFVSVHPYISNYESDTNGMYNKTKWLFDLCKKYNANCSRVINSEWNVGNVLIKNSSQNSTRFETNIALAYSDVLNNWPSNVSMVLYQWSEAKKYLQTTNYPEYPQRWSMVSEPALDNVYYPSYNVTKNFATYHSAGSMIVKSNSNGNIKVVASKKQKEQYITLINIGANTSLRLNVTGNISSSIKDLETGGAYVIKSGMAEVGTISQYQIRYFVNYSMLDVGGNESKNGTNESYGDNKYLNGGGEGKSYLQENTINETGTTNPEDGGRGSNEISERGTRNSISEQEEGGGRGGALTGKAVSENEEKMPVFWKIALALLILGIIFLTAEILYTIYWPRI